MKTKTVKCRSGLTGWQCKLQDNYLDLETFESYSGVYGLAERLGFATAQEAWEANPTIQGSVEPSDYCRVLSVGEFLQKHQLEGTGRIISGPMSSAFEFTPVSTPEMVRDLENMNWAFTESRADNKDHPDYGKEILIFVVSGLDEMGRVRQKKNPCSTTSSSSSDSPSTPTA